MDTEKRVVFYGRYWRHGASFGVTIPPEVRERMKFVVGDTLAMMVLEHTLCIVRITPDVIISRDKANRIFERLFAGKKPLSESVEAVP
jgi:bifunctional DNA-binding transcriptional regulator/antitoxin component of YhaV-PrlF toxin-antitoxin module